MCVPDPWKCTRNADGYEQICDDTSNKNCIVVILMVDEYKRDPENKPNEAGGSTTWVYTSKVLKNRGAS